MRDSFQRFRAFRIHAGGGQREDDSVYSLFGKVVHVRGTAMAHAPFEADVPADAVGFQIVQDSGVSMTIIRNAIFGFW